MKISLTPDTYYHAEFLDGHTITASQKAEFDIQFQEYKLEGNTPIKKEQVTHVFESQDADTFIMHIQDLIRNQTFFQIENPLEEQQKIYRTQLN